MPDLKLTVNTQIYVWLITADTQVYKPDNVRCLSWTNQSLIKLTIQINIDVNNKQLYRGRSPCGLDWVVFADGIRSCLWGWPHDPQTSVQT